MESEEKQWYMPKTRLVAEDLPNEHFLRFYNIFQHSAFLMATSSFVITAFVILKASTKNMETYKWFLLHEIVWSYVFDIFICLWTIIPLFPYQCGYSIGFMRHTNPHVMQIILKFAIACGVGKAFSLFIAFLHRNVQALPACSFKQRYQASKRLKKIFFLIWLSLEVLIVGPLFIADISDQEGIKNFFSSQDPLMKDIHSREPSTVCYVLDTKVKFIYGAVWIIVSGVVLAFPPIMINMLYWILKTKHNVSSSTFRLQWMLFVGISVQVICSFLCFFIPLYIGMIFGFLSVSKAPIIVCYLICLASFHSTLDCFVIIIFIKPYRSFVFNNLLRLIGKKQSTTSTVQIFATAMNGLEPATMIQLNNITIKNAGQ